MSTMPEHDSADSNASPPARRSRWQRFSPSMGWSAFWSEILIVVLGVAIALASSEAVDAWNWRNKVRDAEVRLKSDTDMVFMWSAELLSVRPCVIAQLDAHARRIMDDVRAGRADYAFIEVMCCPGGCIGGGGQPYGTSTAVREARIAATYAVDAAMPLRKSHQNPAVQRLYKDFLGKPLGEKSHQLLHKHIPSE